MAGIRVTDLINELNEIRSKYGEETVIVVVTSLEDSTPLITFVRRGGYAINRDAIIGKSIERPSYGRAAFHQETRPLKRGRQ